MTKRQMEKQNDSKMNKEQIEKQNDSKVSKRKIEDQNDSKLSKRDIKEQNDSEMSKREIDEQNDSEMSKRQREEQNDSETSKREIEEQNDSEISKREIEEQNDSEMSKRQIEEQNDSKMSKRQIEEHSDSEMSKRQIEEHNDSDMSKRQIEEQNDSDDCIIIVESVTSTRQKQSKRGISSRRTISRLQQNLDSKQFQDYLENLWGTFTEEQKASCTYLDSMWFALYTMESYKGKVLNWIKQKDISSKKYVLVPIVMWSHWSLLILCHFRKNLRSQKSKPCMLLLDSLQNAEPKRLEPYIREFVLEIYNVKGPGKKKEASRIPLFVPKVPQQRCSERCGHFVLYYIKLFVCRAPEDLIIEGCPPFMNEDWFDYNEFDSFCKNLTYKIDDVMASSDTSPTGRTRPSDTSSTVRTRPSHTSPTVRTRPGRAVKIPAKFRD